MRPRRRCPPQTSHHPNHADIVHEGGNGLDVRLCRVRPLNRIPTAAEAAGDFPAQRMGFDPLNAIQGDHISVHGNPFDAIPGDAPQAFDDRATRITQAEEDQGTGRDGERLGSAGLRIRKGIHDGRCG